MLSYILSHVALSTAYEVGSSISTYMWRKVGGPDSSDSTAHQLPFVFLISLSTYFSIFTSSFFLNVCMCVYLW